MTFNNLDARAWKVVLEAFRQNDLACMEVDYQVPAVVSSKAQFSINASYVGDFYCVFSRQSAAPQAAGTTELRAALLPVFLAREGVVAKNLATRTLLLEIIRNNLDLELLDEIGAVTASLATEDGDFWVLRPEIAAQQTAAMADLKLGTIVRQIALAELESGRMPVAEFFGRVARQTAFYGSPTLEELGDLLRGTVSFDKGFAYLQWSRQLRLAL